MPPSKAARPSRITIACNSCRTRKQKCSGKRPVCTQCSQNNRRCDWPEQLKRGPAKGYIDVLEHRLHETENALLMALSRISDEQFLDVSTPDPSNHLPFRRQEKKGAEYWREFPLDTAQNIRKWQYDNQDSEAPESSHEKKNSRPKTADTNAMVEEPHTNISRTTPGLNIRRDMSESESISNMPHKTSLIDTHSTPRPVCNMPQTFPIGQRVDSESSQPTTPLYQQNGPLSGTNEHSNSPHIPQEPSKWTEAPSIKFQEQFLW